MGLRTKEPTVAMSSGDEEDLDNDGGDDYSDKNDDDYSCNDDASDDHGSGDDNSSDDYSCNDDDSNDDGDDIDNDDDDGGGDGTDNLCAICDNGGKLLCCEGQCKRSFHPREKDGRESNCETLGLTSAQLQEIGHYLCKNCEYKQHQCFSCGDLEPSDGPNAKVFQCYKASCGHFYHPSCIAKLLEPDDTDGARELEKRIAAGMSFTCPAHWCSECRTMEDGTQIALWLAVCRRCPVSYHKKCLPRSISFERKRGTSIRAWHLDDRIIIYCGRHKLEAALGAPRRDHIKLPSSTEMDTVGTHCMDQIKLTSVPEIDRTRDLAKKKTKVTGKRKMNTDQGSTGTAELSNKLCGDEADQTQTVDMNNLREDIIPKGRGVLEKETIRLNQAHNDELENIIVEEQAEEDENNTKSGKEGETHRRENVLEKEKTPGNESNKFGLTNGRFTSGSDGDRQVDGSYACQQELKSPHCNDNHKTTGIDTSSDKSRKRQRQKEQATERNRKKFHMETGRDARQSPQHLHNHKKPDANQSSCCSSSKNHPRRNDDQRSSMTFEHKSREGRGSSREEWRNNMKENSYRGHSPLGRKNPQNRSRRHSPGGRRMEYRNSRHRSNNQHRYEQHRHDDYFRDGGGGRRRSSRREDYSSDVDIGGRRLHRRGDYSSDVDIGGRRSSRREDYYSDGDRRRLSHRQDYCSDGDNCGRRLSPHDDGAIPSPPSYLRTQYGASRRHGSPSYQRRSEHAASGRRDPYLNPRGSEHADYEMEWRTVPLHHNPPNVEYDEYTTDLGYRGHPAMDNAPVNTYSLREGSPGAYGPETDAGMGEQAAFHVGRFSDHGVRPDYP